MAEERFLEFFPLVWSFHGDLRSNLGIVEWWHSGRDLITPLLPNPLELDIVTVPCSQGAVCRRNDTVSKGNIHYGRTLCAKDWNLDPFRHCADCAMTLTWVHSNDLHSMGNSLTCRGSEDRRTMSCQPGLRGSSTTSGGNTGKCKFSSICLGLCTALTLASWLHSELPAHLLKDSPFEACWAKGTGGAGSTAPSQVSVPSSR